jgi:hypothetical protein
MLLAISFLLLNEGISEWNGMCGPTPLITTLATSAVNLLLLCILVSLVSAFHKMKEDARFYLPFLGAESGGLHTVTGQFLLLCVCIDAF